MTPLRVGGHWQLYRANSTDVQYDKDEVSLITAEIMTKSADNVFHVFQPFFFF